jgi:hypothetical protein
VQREPGHDELRERGVGPHDQRVVAEERMHRALERRRLARVGASISSSAAPRVERQLTPSHSTQACAIVAAGAAPLPTPITIRAGSP